MSTAGGQRARGSRRFLSPDWWLRDRHGRLAVVQAPNPALAVWLLTLLVGATGLTPHRDAALAQVGRGALVVWAVDELLRGSTPFRRLLGLVVLVVEIVGFFS